MCNKYLLYASVPYFTHLILHSDILTATKKKQNMLFIYFMLVCVNWTIGAQFTCIIRWILIGNLQSSTIAIQTTKILYFVWVNQQSHLKFFLLKFLNSFVTRIPCTILILLALVFTHRNHFLSLSVRFWDQNWQQVLFKISEAKIKDFKHLIRHVYVTSAVVKLRKVPLFP